MPPLFLSLFMRTKAAYPRLGLQRDILSLRGVQTFPWTSVMATGLEVDAWSGGYPL